MLVQLCHDESGTDKPALYSVLLQYKYTNACAHKWNMQNSAMFENTFLSTCWADINSLRYKQHTQSARPIHTQDTHGARTGHPCSTQRMHGSKHHTFAARNLISRDAVELREDTHAILLLDQNPIQSLSVLLHLWDTWHQGIETFPRHVSNMKSEPHLLHSDLLTIRTSSANLSCPHLLHYSPHLC